MNAMLSGPLCSNLGLAVSRLLLPIDLARCPLEVLPLANRFVKPYEGEIVLLHVLDLRPDSPFRSVSEVDRRLAERLLQRIARDNVVATVEARFRVRIGIPHEEIAAEAAAAKADLILLPVFAPSFWRRMTGSGYGETARGLVADAPCGVFVVDARTRFNCKRHWASEESPLRAA
jgi:nucleotide-binding universal stress UspA family protein